MFVSSELISQVQKEAAVFLMGKMVSSFGWDLHTQKQVRDHLYCSLCGINRKTQVSGVNNAVTSPTTPSFRGHRSSFKCNLCHVHLCVRTYPGLRKSCWELWHSKVSLEARDTPAPKATRTHPSSSPGASDSHTDEDSNVRPVARRRKRARRVSM